MWVYTIFPFALSLHCSFWLMWCQHGTKSTQCRIKQLLQLSESLSHVSLNHFNLFCLFLFVKFYGKKYLMHLWSWAGYINQLDFLIQGLKGQCDIRQGWVECALSRNRDQTVAPHQIYHAFPFPLKEFNIFTLFYTH